MLILSRLPSQKIIIGNKGDIIISVLSVDGDEVKLGLVAAKDVVKTVRQPTQTRRKIPLTIKIKAFCSKISATMK
jgi:sRNA-binding carbon storage regulator CsrA